MKYYEGAVMKHTQSVMPQLADPHAHQINVVLGQVFADGQDDVICQVP